MGVNLQVRVGVEWIDTFHNDGCKQSNLSYCDDQAEGFYNTMGGHGHVRVFDWGQDNAWETDFTAPSFGGDSRNWTDNVHFCFYDSHGGNWDSVLHIVFAHEHRFCQSSSDEWELGAGILKWMVFAGCEAVLNTSAAHVGAVWFGPMRGVHIVMGYIGDAADSWWTDDLGSDFADDICGGDAIAGSWCDRAYSFWTGDDSIAIAAGTTRDDAINRRENETLNWRDFPVASTSWLAWKWRS
jgi:Family of unknown function (DUF6345)